MTNFFKKNILKTILLTLLCIQAQANTENGVFIIDADPAPEIKTISSPLGSDNDSLDINLKVFKASLQSAVTDIKPLSHKNSQ